MVVEVGAFISEIDTFWVSGVTFDVAPLQAIDNTIKVNATTVKLFVSIVLINVIRSTNIS